MEQWIQKQKLEEKDAWFKDHPVKVEWFGGLPAHPLMNSLIGNFKAVAEEDPLIEAAPWLNRWRFLRR